MALELKYNEDVFNEYIKSWRANVNQDIINRFFIRFTYHSVRMICKKILLEDVEAIFKGSSTNLKGNKRTINQIRNYKEIYEKYFNLDKKNTIEFSVNLIENLNYILMKDCYINEMIRNSEVYGENLTAIDIKSKNSLTTLIEDVRERLICDNNIIKSVSYFYCYFVKDIFPISYNNEVLARILINYLLLEENVPPLIIFENDMNKYYSSLEYFDNTRDICKIHNFFKEESYKTWVNNYYLRLKRLKDFLCE